MSVNTVSPIGHDAAVNLKFWLVKINVQWINALINPPRFHWLGWSSFAVHHNCCKEVWSISTVNITFWLVRRCGGGSHVRNAQWSVKHCIDVLPDVKVISILHTFRLMVKVVHFNWRDVWTLNKRQRISALIQQ